MKRRERHKLQTHREQTAPLRLTRLKPRLLPPAVSPIESIDLSEVNQLVKDWGQVPADTAASELAQKLNISEQRASKFLSALYQQDRVLIDIDEDCRVVLQYNADIDSAPPGRTNCLLTRESYLDCGLSDFANSLELAQKVVDYARSRCGSDTSAAYRFVQLMKLVGEERELRATVAQCNDVIEQCRAKMQLAAQIAASTSVQLSAAQENVRQALEVVQFPTDAAVEIPSLPQHFQCKFMYTPEWQALETLE
jgi:hypothetical protein